MLHVAYYFVLWWYIVNLLIHQMHVPLHLWRYLCARIEETSWEEPASYLYQISIAPRYHNIQLAPEKSSFPRFCPNLSATMPLRTYCSILISSIAVCLISTVCCIFAPLDLMQKVLPLLSNTYMEHQIRFQENLLGDLDHSPLHLIVWVCARYAFRIFLYCGKEIICLTSVIHFCPTMKGKCCRDCSLLGYLSWLSPNHSTIPFFTNFTNDP